MTPLSTGASWLLDACERQLDVLVDTVTRRIHEEIPEYAGLDEVRGNTAQHVRTFLQWARVGGDVDELLTFEADITIGRLQAGFELLPTLAAYRIGEVQLWQWLLATVREPDVPAGLDAVDELSALWFEYHQHARNVTIANYLRADRQRAAVEAADRRDLLADLANGRVSSSEAERRLRRLGCDVGRAYTLVIIDLPSSPLSTAVTRSQQVAVRLQSTLHAATGLRPFVVATQSQVTALVPWIQSSASIEPSVHQALQSDSETRARVAMSLPVGGLHEVRDAHRQAQAALEMCTVERPFVVMERLSALDFLLQSAAPDVLGLAPASVRRELAHNEAYAAELDDTLSAYLGSGMRARGAAERLHVHTNTVYYRLNRIEQLLGIDAQDYWQLLDLLLYVRVLRRLGVAPRRTTG